MAAANPFWAPINAKVEQQHQDALDLAKQQRESYQSIVQDPNTSDEVKNWAWGEWQKSLHPEARKKFAPVQPLVQKILGAFGGGGGQARQPMDEKLPNGQTPAAAVQSGPQVARPAGPSPVPAPTAPVYDTAAANKRVLDLLQQKSNIEQGRQIAVQQSKPAAGTVRNLQYKLPDGSVVSVQQHTRTGQYFTPQGEPYALPEGAEPYKAPSPGTRKQFRYKVDGKEVTVFQDSKTQQMFDIHGKPFELPENAEPVDEEAKLAAIRGSFYGTGEMNNLKRSFKAQNSELSDDQAEAMAGAWVQEAAKRRIENIGAARSTERPMVVGGEVRAVPFSSGNVPRPIAAPAVPQAPGAVPPGMPPSAVAAPAATNPTAPATAPKPSPTAASPAGAAQGAGAPGRVIGIPPAQYRAQLNDIRAVRAGAAQLFGDPNVPSVKGLIDYSDLADNKDSRDRLGRALRLTFDGLDQSTGGGHAGVSGEHGALNVGGIGTWVGNTLGIPSAVADQQAKMFQDAVSKLTPREREAYNATIASAEGIIGLRRITGASPSQSSVRAIQEAMPIIGVNTTDQAQFNDKARRLAVEFSAGTRGVPSSGFDAETRKQLEEINKLPERLAPRSGAAPKSAPSLPVVKSQADFDKLKPGDYFMEDGNKYMKPKTEGK